MTTASTLSREALWLRFAGMAGMFGGLAGGALLADAADSRQLLQAVDPAALVPWAIGGLAAANAFALGLILLLAGMRHVSLMASARARHGALVKLGAMNLLAVAGAFTAFQDAGALDRMFAQQWYLAIPLLIGFVLVARSGFRLFRSGWKYDALTAAEAVAADPRPPVVYLRSFDADPQILVTGRGPLARAAGWLNYAASVSPEQELALILDRVGPVIAIGKPGERLPELGASRRYVADEEWRDVVAHLMSGAALVVFRAGDTENLWWEIEQAMARCAPTRIIIVVLGPAGTLPAFGRRFASAFGTPAQSPRPPEPRYMHLVQLMFPYGRSAGRILYFDEHGMPREEPLAFRLTWSTFVLAAFRPHRDSLQAGFRTVFAHLGLPWTRQRSPTTAVLLALLGGIFGLHHFYMGHTRKGLWYLAFSWIAIPIVLGWIDAARLASLDDAQFQSRLRSGSTS